MGHSGLDAVAVGHVQLHHMGVAALTFNVGPQRLEFVHPAAGQHHGSPGLGQRTGKLRPQPAGCTGDKSNPA